MENARVNEFYIKFLTLEVEELEKLDKIIDVILEAKRKLNNLETDLSLEKFKIEDVRGKVVRDIKANRNGLVQGRATRIDMIDENGEIVKTFDRFIDCADYLRDELEVKNSQNKLRRILLNEEKIRGYSFIKKGEE